MRGEAGDGRAPSSGFGRRIGEMLDEWCPRENRADDFTLHADAFAVDDAHASEPCATGFAEVFLDDARHVARGDGVQIEDVADFQTNGFCERIERVNVRRFFIWRGRGSTSHAAAGFVGA